MTQALAAAPPGGLRSLTGRRRSLGGLPATTALLGSLLYDTHRQGAWFVIVGNAVAGLWALGAHRWEQLRVRYLWWLTAVVELAVAVQVVLGVVLLNTEKRRPEQFHMFYGFVAFATVGIIYAYRAQLRDQLYLLYGGGGLFLMGLGIRAIQVSGR